MLDAVFGASDKVAWYQECARAVVIFAYGLILVRFAGRRVFAKWAPLDIVVSVIVGSSLSRALTGNAPLWGTLAATALLALLHWLLSHAAARSTRLSQLLEGRPVVLGQGGKVEPRALAKHAVSEADLHEALRAAGLQDVSATRALMLEPSGKISILKN